MKYITMTLLIMTMSISSMLNAQPAGDSFLNPQLDNAGLFNPNNLQMNHSMSFMTGYSGGGEGFYQSTYTNHLFYRFNPKLDLQVDLNFINFGTAGIDNRMSISGNQDNESRVVPEFSLNYRPTQNSQITIQYRHFHNPYQTSNWRW